MEGKMTEIKESMHEQDQKTVVFWVHDQVAIKFFSKEPPSAEPKSIIESLNLMKFNQILNQQFHYNLVSFTEKDIPRSSLQPYHLDQDEKEEQLETLLNRVIRSVVEEGTEVFEKIRDLFKRESVTEKKLGNGEQESSSINNLNGKYIFPSTDNESTLVIAFFHIQKVGDTQTNINSTVSGSISIVPDVTPMVVASINNNASVFGNDPNDPNRPIAMPNWLSGSTNGPDFVTHGCPVSPPIPVPANESCSSSPGLWPISLQLPKEMQSMTGSGVTVFVLDTLPHVRRIKAAAHAAGNRNLLLQDLAESVTFKHYALPQFLDVPGPMQVATGKDISGQLEGFEMPDHGLFVAGIIHDLAHNANIECIRVLNDEGVGDGQTLVKMFNDILKRMSPPGKGKRAGDLYQQPIVINMSLVTTPDDEELSKRLPNVSPTDVRATLEMLIEIMTAQGVVIVASAGNDSDPRDTSMNMGSGNTMGTRQGPRFPASSENVIAVGALNKFNRPASYSNKPGPKEMAIATYGGELPTAVPAVNPDSIPPSTDCMTSAKVSDAIIGVYAALSYPALSAEDCEPSYPIPNPNAWAYWSGTSFATPIISAVAARVLELQLRGKLQTGVWDSIKSASQGITADWGENFVAPIIQAVQKCAPSSQQGTQDQGSKGMS
jgi:Subtilase family